MNELTDEQLDAVIDQPTPVAALVDFELFGKRALMRHFARAVIAADRAQQSARHAEELAAYELTVSSLRSQREQAQPVPCPDNPSWHYERLDRLLSMTLSAESYEDYLYSLNIVAAPQAQPERKPMSIDDAWDLTADCNGIGDVEGARLIRAVEAFHGITGESK